MLLVSYGAFRIIRSTSSFTFAMGISNLWGSLALCACMWYPRYVSRITFRELVEPYSELLGDPVSYAVEFLKRREG